MILHFNSIFVDIHGLRRLNVFIKRKRTYLGYSLPWLSLFGRYLRNGVTENVRVNMKETVNNHKFVHGITNLIRK